MKRGDKPGKIRAGLSFSGWIYVVLTLVIGLAAVNSSNNVLFLLTSLLLALLLFSGITALYNVSGLKVSVFTDGVLTQGRPGIVQVAVQNTRKFSSLVLNVSLDSSSALIVHVPGKTEKHAFLSWTPPKRGRPIIPPVVVMSSFPFGFVRRGSSFDTGTRFIVAPAPLEIQAEEIFPGRPEDVFHEAKGQGSGEWKGIRPYRQGEGRANIVWKRLDLSRPVMRDSSSFWPAHSFSLESSESMTLDWNDSAFAGLDTEKRLCLFRTMLDRAMNTNMPWKLILPQQDASGRGTANYEHGLHLLSLVEPLP